jgi:hypothetical protein
VVFLLIEFTLHQQKLCVFYFPLCLIFFDTCAHTLLLQVNFNFQFAKFSATVSNLKDSINSYDSALFIHCTDRGIILLLLYVDDMIITGDDSIGILELKQFLSQHFEMKDLGTLSYFLGLEIYSSSDGSYLTQAKYISNLLSWATLIDCKNRHAD